MEPKGQVKPSRFADEDITLFCVVILIIGAFFRLFPVWNTLLAVRQTNNTVRPIMELN